MDQIINQLTDQSNHQSISNQSINHNDTDIAPTAAANRMQIVYAENILFKGGQKNCATKGGGVIRFR